MKTIGLIGRTGWGLMQLYYKIINETANKKLGEFQCSQRIPYSVNFEDIYACNMNEDSEGVHQIMQKGAETIAKAAVDFIALCANSIHFTYKRLSQDIDLIFVLITGVTGNAIKKKGLKKI